MITVCFIENAEADATCDGADAFVPAKHPATAGTQDSFAGKGVAGVRSLQEYHAAIG